MLNVLLINQRNAKMNKVICVNYGKNKYLYIYKIHMHIIYSCKYVKLNITFKDYNVMKNNNNTH